MDEIIGFMCNIRFKIVAHNAMPRGIVLLIEFFLYEFGDILYKIFTF